MSILKSMPKLLKFFLSRDVIAITLFPYGIYLDFSRIPTYNVKRIFNHELIHWKQQIEMLIIPFYLWYIIEWLIRLCIKRNSAYDDLSFEREATTYENDNTYITTRKHYSWVKYLKK